MVLGIDPLTSGTLLLLAAASGAPECPLPGRAPINVTPRALEVRYDYSKSLSQIQNYTPTTQSPHSYGNIGYTQGFMQGQLTVAPRVTIKHATYGSGGIACAWYDRIDVVLELDPKILIAKEVYADPCMRAAVTAHEMKHVAVDRAVMNKYAKSMGDRIYALLEERGSKSRPVGIMALSATVKQMQDAVQNIVNHEAAKMNLERTERQQAIDNRAEYEKVSAACPGFARQQRDPAPVHRRFHRYND